MTKPPKKQPVADWRASLSAEDKAAVDAFIKLRGEEGLARVAAAWLAAPRFRGATGRMSERGPLLQEMATMLVGRGMTEWGAATEIAGREFKNNPKGPTKAALRTWLRKYFGEHRRRLLANAQPPKASPVRRQMAGGLSALVSDPWGVVGLSPTAGVFGRTAEQERLINVAIQMNRLPPELLAAIERLAEIEREHGRTAEQYMRAMQISPSLGVRFPMVDGPVAKKP